MNRRRNPIKSCHWDLKWMWLIHFPAIYRFCDYQTWRNKTPLVSTCEFLQQRAIMIYFLRNEGRDSRRGWFDATGSFHSGHLSLGIRPPRSGLRMQINVSFLSKTWWRIWKAAVCHSRTVTLSAAKQLNYKRGNGSYFKGHLGKKILFLEYFSCKNWDWTLDVMPKQIQLNFTYWQV